MVDPMRRMTIPEILKQSLRFEFETTKNQVKYEALLADLRLAKEVGAKHLKYWSDSKLVTGKLNFFVVTSFNPYFVGKIARAFSLVRF